jgi:hypothetical protein
MKRKSRSYVADRWQHNADGKRIYGGLLGGSGWMVLSWDEVRQIHIEGACYPTKRAAEQALRESEASR